METLLHHELDTPTDPSSSMLRDRNKRGSRMPFNIRDLSVLAYANGFTLWHYRPADTAADTAADNFFGDAGDMMAPGDIIMVSGPAGARIVVVETVTYGSVTVAPLS